MELICNPYQVEQLNKNLQLQNRDDDLSVNQTQLSKWRLYMLQVHDGVGRVSGDPFPLNGLT